MNNLQNDPEILNYKKELEILEELKKQKKIELEIEKYKYNEIVKYSNFLKNKYETDEEDLREKSFNKELQNKIDHLEYQIKKLKEDDSIFNIFYDLFY